MEAPLTSQLSELGLFFSAVVGFSVVYGQWFGPVQVDITQAFVDAFGVAHRWRRLVNYGVGLAMAMLFVGAGAGWLGHWEVLPAGVLAGLLASREAGAEYDRDAHGSGTLDRS